MKFFNLDDIKTQDCRSVARDLLGLELNANDRTAATWRGGKNPNVHIDQFGWYDHKEKKGGSCIDLVMAVKGVEFNHAVELIGSSFNLVEKAGLKQAPSRKKVTEYVYKDKNGNPVHKTIRWDPKEFSQSKWNAKKETWESGLTGVEPLPYNLPAIATVTTIYLHEGEKDADACAELGFPSTTLPMGAGEWRATYNQYFNGKNLVVIADNDDAGKEHARRICYELRNDVKQIKVLTVSDKPKGDFSDFIQDGGTKEKFKALVRQTEKIDLAALAEPVSKQHDDAVKIAKEMNRTAFANYERIREFLDNGDTKTFKRPRQLKEMLTDVNRRLLGFPKRVGSTLFDHDRDTGDIRFITSPVHLQAWIGEKTGHNVELGKMEGVASMEQLFVSVYDNAEQYESISGVPNFPLRNDTYYTYGDLPKPTPDAHYFERFVGFFNPETVVDRALVKAATMSPLFFRPMCDKPMFVIDSNTGMGSGKSKLVDMICLLYGDAKKRETGAPIEVLPESINNEYNIERVYKRILSRTGRQKRIVRIDNITGYFKSDALASLITQAHISGMSPYAKGEETRPMDLQFFATSNRASLCADLVSRSLIIHISKPKAPEQNWEKKVYDFIQAHQLQIFADMMGMIERGVDFNIDPASRFRVWEKEILAPACGEADLYQQAWKQVNQRRTSANGEYEETDTIRNYIIEVLTESGFDTDSDVIFVTAEALIDICQKAIPGYGGKTGRNITHLLRLQNQAGHLPELSDLITVFPHNGKQRRRGLLWDATGKLSEAKQKRCSVNIRIAEYRDNAVNERFI